MLNIKKNAVDLNVDLNVKSLSLSCKNCNRMTEIEGELVCFEQGKIKCLTLDPSPAALIKMVCINWQKK
ncbi:MULTISPECIES: hypothetical protein [Shewanella]|jgi:hypothetical protein|uniref:Uncharacterized protein n=1 Tax=Shewanella vesiculosa TaxID=518738 RepID=A0ABV0FSV3_9GAMM|nr:MULTISPECIES: hypothetical protein [Shewanella]|tara:strand:- start:1022 stop:1228 length:207 start_codon:yes stop_codon:yes gene_type:complete